MIHRTSPALSAQAVEWFVPWELLPLGLACFLIPRYVRGGARLQLGVFWIVSLLALAATALLFPWSPHHWILPWVVPGLLLTELGFAWLPARARFSPRALVAGVFVANAIFQSGLVALELQRTAGAAWHGPEFSIKKEAMAFIAEKFPRHRLLMATPGEEWTGSLVAWTAFASLPGEFLGRWSPRGPGTLFIEERDAQGAFSGFPEVARAREWLPVWSHGSITLWEAQGAIEGLWPRVTVIESRQKP